MHIEVRGASLRFGRRTVFEHFDAWFAEGHVTALVGPSGSGKSSLLAAMAGYQRLTDGAIIGVDSNGTEHAVAASTIAWVPQGTNALGARTALENVLIAPLAEGSDVAASVVRAMDALEAVGLADLAGVTARKLSGGELQRVNFARALAADKPFIFADEPSSSLDARNTERIAELLYSLRSRSTIIVATHDPLLVDAAEATVDLRSEPRHDA